MTAAFDLADLLDRAALTRDPDGVLWCSFAYPSSPDGRPALRRVRRPVLLVSAAGEWRLRGRDAAREGAVRAFRIEHIASPDLAPTTPTERSTP